MLQPTEPRDSLLGQVGRWLRRLNRVRLARRKAARRAEIARQWFAHDDPARPEVAAALSARMRSMPRHPQLAVVAWPPGTDVLPADWPFGARGSMYPHWQLLTTRATCSSTARAATQSLDDAVAGCKADAVVVVPVNGQLAQHALLLFAEALTRFQDAILVYADEDRLDARGQRSRAVLKCDWNAELLRSFNYIGGCACVRRCHWHVASDAPGDSEDTVWWSMLLHWTESSRAGQVVHIPHVLSHRPPTDYEPLRPVLPKANADMLAVVQAHLDRCEVPASALAAPQGGVWVRYRVREPAPRVSIIIPTRNGLALLRQCLPSILDRTRYRNFEVLIVDNGSDEPATLDYLRDLGQDPRVRVHRDDRPFNYSALNNAAASMCSGELLAFVNNDVEVITPDWLDEMVGIAVRPDVGIVGARLWYPDGTVQHAGVILGIGGIAGHIHRLLARDEPGYLGRAHLAQEFSAVTGACMVMRRELFVTLGGLDEEHLAVDFNDIDLCLRAREAGYRVIWTPHAELIHHESATRGRVRPPQQQQRFDAEVAFMQRRWGAVWLRDPAFNRNLSLDDTNGAISESPRVDLQRPWFD